MAVLGIPSLLAAAMIAAITLIIQYARHSSERHSPIVVRFMGVSKVGKTTILKQLQTRGPVAAPDKTRAMGAPYNIKYRYFDGEHNVHRTLNFRDFPGEDWDKGMFWRILTRDRPAAIIYMIDHRAIQSTQRRFGEPKTHDQLAAFEALVSNILSEQYAKDVPEPYRVRSVTIACNKRDVYTKDGLTHEELALPFEPARMALQANGIDTHVIPLRSNRIEDDDRVSRMMALILGELEFERRPIRDAYYFLKLAMRDDMRAAKNAVKKGWV